MPAPGGGKKKGQKKTKISKPTEVAREEESVVEVGFVPAPEEKTVHWGESYSEQVFGLESEEEDTTSLELTPPLRLTPQATSTPVGMTSEDKIAELQARLDQAMVQIDKLTSAAQDQESKIQDLTSAGDKSPAKSPSPSATSEKLQLPLKYDGTSNLESYLVQFETIADEQGWNAARKGMILLGRLKGRALDVATQGTSNKYGEMLERLKTHFTPESEDMYAQQLQAVRKEASHTWEDLAFQVRDLARKAYKSANDSVKERLAVEAFIGAVEDDELRQKLRDSNIKKLEEVLQRVRKLEADQVIERQRAKEKKTVRTIQKDEDDRMTRLEEEVRTLQASRSGGGRGVPTSTQNGESRGPQVGNRGRGRGKPRLCFFCDSPDHMQRNCPYRIAWIQQQRQQYQFSMDGRGMATPRATNLN